jgi:hypothetical protein
MQLPTLTFGAQGGAVVYSPVEHMLLSGGTQIGPWLALLSFDSRSLLRCKKFLWRVMIATTSST